MEIIFNPASCQTITGKLRTNTPWYIHRRKGRFYGVCRTRAPALKRRSFAVFYADLLQLKKQHIVHRIILTNQERTLLQ